MPCYSPLKGWKDNETGGIKFRRDGAREEMEVACGQCLGCRLDRSRMWAMRIVHECSVHEAGRGNCFVTLTYRDPLECSTEQLEDKKHVPDDWSLQRSHFTKFMKRLRSKLWHYDSDGRKVYEKVRYFMCGEYGYTCEHMVDLERFNCFMCNVGRPHYHAILFGVTFPDLVAYGTSQGESKYTSKFLEDIWRYGFVDVGEANYETAAYVARYVLKKVTGAMADDHYMGMDTDGVATFLEPEYCTMTRGHRYPECKDGHIDGCKCTGGIGKEWFDKYKDDVFPSDEVPVPGSGVFKGVPRYYEEIFKCTDALSLEEIKEVRQEFMRAHELIVKQQKVDPVGIENLTKELGVTNNGEDLTDAT